MLQHPPCARYTGFYHGVGAPTGPPLGAPILRIAPYRCPKPSLALTPAAVGLMYAYTNNRGRAVGADLAGAIRVLSGRGYADFHAGTNFAITEFYEVRYLLAPRPVHGGMRRLAAFVTVCTNAPVGMRVGKGEEKACDEWRLC